MIQKALRIIIVIVIILVLSVLYRLYEIQKIPKITLESTITESLKGTKGSYSVTVKNFKTGETYSYEGNKSYQTGSLYKLWIMVTAFSQIQKGDLSEKEVLSSTIPDLNNKFNISSDSAELKEGSITLTVGSALQQMITISHNYAAMLLSERVKLANVVRFLQENGFSESVVGVNLPTSTSSDIALFLEKLYLGKLANPQNTKKMLDLLKAQELKNKLPKYLPTGTIIAHKTGEIDFLTHDGGIVYTKNGDYSIVVLSKSDLPVAAEDRIAQLSKAVYEYMITADKRDFWTQFLN